MAISVAGLNVIRSSEGRSLRAYRDAVGVWTIGYGNTNYDKSLGFTVKAGVTITAAQAESMLLHSLNTQYIPPVDRALPGQTQPARDAGYSFHYNTGAIGRASWVKALVSGNLAAVEPAIMSWNKGAGKVLKGLTRRRAREYAMIARGDYGPEGRSGPSIIDAGADGHEVVTNRQGEALTALPGGAPAEAPTAPMAAAAVPLPPPHPDAVPGQLKQGDTGPEVADLQESLAAAGYPSTDPAGTYEQATKEAVALYQAHHGNLTADGRVGPATTKSLQREGNFRADLTSKSKKGGIAGAIAAVSAFLKGVPVEYYIYGACGLAALLLLYFAWKHRDELQRNLNRSIGRVVP